MATNYNVSNSSEDTHFDEYDRDVIANANRRRRDNLQAIDRDRARFGGFGEYDRPSANSLAWISQMRNNHRLLVSDSRNEPDYTGDTKTLPTGNNEHQMTTAQDRHDRSNVSLPLTSTLRRGGVINFPNVHNESPIVHVRPNTQPYNLGVRNQRGVAQQVTNENRVHEERILQEVSRQAVLGDRQTPVSPRNPEEQAQQSQVEAEVHIRRAYERQSVRPREPGQPSGNGAHIVHEGINDEEDRQSQSGNTNEVEDIGDYRRYFNRKIRTDARILHDRLIRAVGFLSKCEIAIFAAIRHNKVDEYSTLMIEFEGRLELVKDIKKKLEPLVLQIEDSHMSEYLFYVDNEIPAWKALEDRLRKKMKENQETQEKGVAQKLHEIVTSNQDKYKHKPVNMGTSEFPKFDGKIDYYHWWARWSHLAKVSKLNDENLEVKLRESIVEEAEELMGKTLMATGTYVQLCSRLKAIYDKPIQRVQQIADDFFEKYNRKKSNSTVEYRKYLAELEDILLRIHTEGLTAESLMLNMALQKLPDHLKRSVQTELSHSQPNFHLTQTQYHTAFDTVTNRLDRRDEGKVVTSYNNFVKHKENISNKDKNSKKNEPTKGNQEIKQTNKDPTKVSNATKMEEKFCSIHLTKESECDLDTPKKVRDYLEKNDRCIKCGVAKINHEYRCRNMAPCHKHRYEWLYHLPRTCEGGNYRHPGCQFNFNR